MPHADAVFNLGRMGLLIAGLADHAGWWPRPPRTGCTSSGGAALFPEADRILAGLREAGASAVCWSGAGPSILGICTVGTEGGVAQAGATLLADSGLAGGWSCCRPAGLVINR